MNSEIKIQNTQARTVLHMHRRRLIAAYLYDNTRHGKRTTCRMVAAALGVDPNRINSLIRLCQIEPTETVHGPVMVVPMGKRMDSGGVTAMTYAGILWSDDKPKTHDRYIIFY